MRAIETGLSIVGTPGVHAPDIVADIREMEARLEDIEESREVARLERVNRVRDRIEAARDIRQRFNPAGGRA